MDESVEQIDPTQELTTESVKKRAASGAVLLTIRTIFIQVLNFFFSNGLLAAFLIPAQYGVFFLVSAVINFLAYFSDIGFAAALIQKKDKLTGEDLRTVFTVQQTLIILLVIIIFAITPLIRNFYHLNQESVYLLWALAFTLFASSLKTIPSVLLERKLEFNKLVIPQILEAIVFNVTVVYLAWKGFGISSFTLAVLARSIIGLISTYIIQPWLPSISFSMSAFKSILKFGIPYQMNVFLAMVKDDGMTLFLGSIIGPSGVGLLGWAQKWAYAPLRFFMDQVIKVTFPAFSRLQDNKKDLSDLVTKSVFFVCLFVFPSLVMLVLLAPILVDIIPKYNQWRPALFAISVLTITSGLAAVTTPLTNTLNAIGKISTTFKLMTMWTFLTWIFVPLLAVLYGLNGAAAGFTVVGFSSFVALYLVSRYVDINYLQSVGKPLVASCVMGILIFVVKNFLPTSWLQVIILVTIGLISYLLAIFIIEPKLILEIKDILKKKQ